MIEMFSTFKHGKGLVGIGLVRLMSESGLEDPDLGKQLDLANSMGLFLQKTNIIRDYLEDLQVIRDHIFKKVTGRIVYITGRIVYITGRIVYITGRIAYITGRIVHITGRIVYITGRIVYITGRIVYIVVETTLFLKKVVERLL